MSHVPKTLFEWVSPLVQICHSGVCKRRKNKINPVEGRSVHTKINFTFPMLLLGPYTNFSLLVGGFFSHVKSIFPTQFQLAFPRLAPVQLLCLFVVCLLATVCLFAGLIIFLVTFFSGLVVTDKTPQNNRELKATTTSTPRTTPSQK